MRNQYAKALHEGRSGHYASRVHGDQPKRRPTKEELLEEALIQDQLLDEEWDSLEDMEEYSPEEDDV